MEELVSIIIPLYNRKHLIRRCVESVCAQTYKNLEIIVVDDGSTDEPDAVLAELARDPRVKIIRKPNGGVSSARNAGLDAATGTYVQFVDSDDVIVKTATMLAVSAMNRNKADCVTFAHSPYSAKLKFDIPEETKETVYQGVDCYIATIKAGRQCPIWNKLYKREVLGNIRFAETVSWGEDFIFSASYFLRCRIIVSLEASLIKISGDSPESLNKRYSPNGFSDAEAQHVVSLELLDRFKNRELFELLQRYMWGCYIQCVRKLCLRSGKSYREIVRQLHEWAERPFVRWLKIELCPDMLDCYCLKKCWFFILPAVLYGTNLKTKFMAALRCR